MDAHDRRLLLWIAVSTTFLASVVVALLVAWGVFLIVRL
jgi:hypothetical protein